jgi:hypothetical protein
MVPEADEFETYHTEQGRDDYEVKHRASHYFQYFDELTKGSNPGGVAYALNQDLAYKHLVYDLLYQGKFKNWNLIRLLKYDQEVRDTLTHARDMTNLEEAQDLVDDVLHEAHNRRREARVGNPNQRIEVFVKWLEDLGVGTIRQTVRPEIQHRLLDALALTEQVINFKPKKKK